ncbi:MAG: type II toxin-antitoxin system VapC family toxin [Planctomycetaceae bacterium]|nr:type II toxin-antitoxin system VapC family toxin [Planctomycetaceae bacterium]
MTVLVDTSVLGRMANQADLAYPVAVAAVAELHRRNEMLHITPQNLIEFRNIATRPLALNGLGMSTIEANAAMERFEAKFPLLDDTPDIFAAWKAIVLTLGVVGKQVHDARLVAVCHAHAVPKLLTFNSSHFNRFASFGPGIAVLNPANL